MEQADWEEYKARSQEHILQEEEQLIRRLGGKVGTVSSEDYSESVHKYIKVKCHQPNITETAQGCLLVAW